MKSKKTKKDKFISVPIKYGAATLFVPPEGLMTPEAMYDAMVLAFSK